MYRGVSILDRYGYSEVMIHVSVSNSTLVLVMGTLRCDVNHALATKAQAGQCIVDFREGGACDGFMGGWYAITPSLLAEPPGTNQNVLPTSQPHTQHNTQQTATMVAARTPGAATSHRLAWTLTMTTRLYLVTAASCFARPCGAFLVPSPTGSTKLQLTHDTASRSRCRRSWSATRGKTIAAASQGRSNVGEEMELRLMTWMEVETRVKRDTAEVGQLYLFLPKKHQQRYA